MTVNRRKFAMAIAFALSIGASALVIAQPPLPEDGVEAELHPESFLYVHIPTDDQALFSTFAPDHVVRAVFWTEQIWFDDIADPGRCHVRLAIPVDETGLRVDHGVDRRALNFDREELSEWERRQVMADMLAADQLDAQSHPEITVETVDCRADGQQWSATLEVTVRGESAQFDVPLDLEFRNGLFRLTATFDATHGDFGMEPYEGFLGGLRNSETLHFGIRAIGRLRIPES